MGRLYWPGYFGCGMVLAGCGGAASESASAALGGIASSSVAGSIQSTARASGGSQSALGGANDNNGGTTNVQAGGTSQTIVPTTGGNSGLAQGGRALGGVATSLGGTATGGANMARGGAGGKIAGGTSLGGASFGGVGTSGTNGSGGRGNGGATVSGGTQAAGGGESATGGVSTGGSATAGTGPMRAKFVGNITTGSKVDPTGLSFVKHWDQITPETAGKMGSVIPSPTGAYNWTSLDQIYEYAHANNIAFKETAFVWGAPGPTGMTAAIVQDWIKQFCLRYPNTKYIDVVYEPPPHTTPSYANSMGGGTGTTWQWIINAFLWAREACPNAVLMMNDYNNIELADQNAHFIDIVKVIRAAGAPIDAVGAEAHGVTMSTATFSTVQTLLEKLHTETGLPVYITEFDFGASDDAKQLAYYQQYFSLFHNASYVEGITLWGWVDGQTWVSNSGLVKGTTPRPAMTWLMNYLGRPAPP